MATKRPRRKEGGAGSGEPASLGLYSTAEQEAYAVNDEIDRSERFWHHLADEIERGRLPASPYDRLAIATVLRERADRVRPDKTKRGRGRPSLKENALYNKPLIAIEVEWLRQKGGMTAQGAIAAVATRLDREDSDSVGKAYRKHKKLAEEQVKLLTAFGRNSSE